MLLLSNAVFQWILAEVNREREPGERIGALFVNLRSFEVTRLHRELFPHSRKRLVESTLGFLGFAFFVAAVAYVIWAANH